MIPRSRTSGRLILERSAAQAGRLSPSVPSTSRAWILSSSAHRAALACDRRHPTLRPRLAAAATAAASFSTTARLGKEKDKGKQFFDSSVESLSEQESKKKLEKKDREDVDKPAPESKSANPDSLASEKDERPSQQGGKEGKANGAAGSPGGSDSGAGGDSSGGDGGKRGRKSAERALQKPVVPEVYPQVLAIPIARRPLFPGFYKAITIKDPNVATAITESIKRGQPYVGAFLFKDENEDEDVIRNVDDVYDVGVFAQITSAFPIHGQEGALTAILYPHRRIKLSSLVAPGGTEAKKADAKSEPEIPEPIPQRSLEEEDSQSTKKGDVVASFEESAVEKKPDQVAEKYEPTSFLKKYPVSLVNVDNLTDEPYDPKSPVIRAVTNEIVNVFKEVATMNNLFRDQISTFSMSQSTGNVTSEPAKLADFAAAVSSGEQHELQEVLACMNVEERMQKALIVLKKELMNAQLQSKISKDVESKITKRQREYWLMEQMKGIRRELGLESDGKDKLVEKFKEKAAKLAMSDAVRKVFDEEINKLAHLETAASEFNVTRNYLDWLTQIPWGQRSPENFGIPNAIKVLDEDHYGLQDVKDRILEFIAVGKLRGTVEGKILCFVGPPGVGKTSIGKSIARALNREYYRFSVGGLTDVAEIKGHRRTYVGALPGRIIQALKKCQTENPLILIDEVDKIGRGYQGDPSSALLELLDPEQNGSFLDHYMDVPVDLSKVLFVCTANMTDTIPRPLLDRMELITLSGYVADEKKAIANRYLAPAAKEAAGLKNADVNLTDEAIEELIKSYCRESGVRNLKKQIEKVYRKSALKIVQQLGEEVLPEEEALTDEGKAAVSKMEKKREEKAAKEKEEEKEEEEEEVGEGGKMEASASDAAAAAAAAAAATPGAAGESETTAEQPRRPLKVPDSVHVKIGKGNLTDYIGPPVFTSDRLYEVSPPGVSMGLAWTQLGGAAMYIESILQAPLRPSSRPGLEITGNLKSVMKESTSIAYSFVKSLMVTKFPDNDFFDKAKMHLHVPDGAVSKDGPSAGITMATSLLSLALDTPVNPEVAMTGELTLTGKVLRIGGLREKTVAARRAGCKTIIFPQDNLSDWLELPQTIKSGIEGCPVSWYSEVFDLIFPKLDRKKANTSRVREYEEKHKHEEFEKTEDDD
ncbi:Lon protease -like protein [Escovopsis weberi]|uniref:Lon protease homolog, mitochondrial n=1 Tax=Escovopsis weberi TaxID=150374 RepID=A0A0M8MWP4_ESCWE|nr:Lon protease -like protein [Escovopsis weberi]